MLRVFTLAVIIHTAATFATVQGHEAGDYGVDCSFPIHSRNWRCGDLFGNRTKFYEDFILGCRAYHGKQAHRCDSTEDDRIAMSLRQPMSMVNYTNTGFKKIRAPKLLFDLLSAHWEANKHLKKEEVWFVGNTYTNNWESPTYMVAVEDTKLRGGGFQLKQRLWDVVKATIEEWTGMEQKPTSMYGIREYTANAVLSPHVDRLPLVSSCIVNVAQDVDEDWPLEIYDREGKGSCFATAIDRISSLLSFCTNPCFRTLLRSCQCDHDAW
jgi:prolyl 4-hydroxylase